MVDFCSYNVRGLNNKLSSFIKDFVSSNKLKLFALLETHVQKESADYISSYIYLHHIVGYSTMNTIEMGVFG